LGILYKRSMGSTSCLPRYGIDIRIKILYLSFLASAVCSLPKLQAALVNVGITSKNLYSANGGIIAGGWVQLYCANGLTLNPFSGSLNITCQATGEWTPFPVCL
jgi:hypothetical protein